MDSDPVEDPSELTKAYGAASHAGDTEAMSDLHGRLLKAYQNQDKAQNNPTTGMSDTSLRQAGFIQGAKRLGQGLGNLVGVVPDQTLKDEDELYRPLNNTGAGKFGNIMGQVGATAPLGGAGGGLTKAVGPALAKVGTYLPGVFRTALAGGEGALQGASAAEVGHQGEGAATGAALGAGLSTLGSAVGKGVRGLVKKSEPAQRLMQDADEEGKDLFIPISQGGTGAAKQIYQKALPYALGVETQLAKQSGKAKDVVSEIAADRGMPAQADAAGTVQKTQAPIGDTMEDTAAGMRKTYDDAYQNTVKSYAFKPPDDFGSRIKDSLDGLGLPKAHVDAIADHADNVLQEFMEPDGTISGENLLRAKAAAKKTLPGLKSANGSSIGGQEAADKASEVYDSVVQDAIDEHKVMAGGPTAKVEHEVGAVGDHKVTSPNGEAHAQESGPYLQMNRIDVKPGAQNGGEGVSMMQRLHDEATSRGLQLASDVSVSKDQQNIYAAMKRRGYAVQENPSTPGVKGSKVSADPRVPVYTVGDRTLSKAQQQAASVSRDLENYQRLGPSQAEGDAVASTSEANPADRGALKFGNLAKNAPENSSVKSLAQDAHEVLEKESSGGVNPAGRHFLHGGEAVAALIHPGLAPGLIGGNLVGNTLATKTAQKGLYGDLAPQKALAEFLRKHPQAAYSAGLAGRSAANASGQ